MVDIDKVWQEYSQKKDPAITEKLILHYASLVKYVAGRLSMHIGQHVEHDDLVSYGIFGLIDAIDKFDFNKGVKFETYASLRIRGAIIDNIRKLDWVPRTIRQKSKTLEAAYQELESELGREPSNEELAMKLDLTLSETTELVKKSCILTLISLDDYLEQNHEANFNNAISLEQESPETQYERKELSQILAEAIDKLNDKEKQVITFYHYENLTLKEISVILEVSESRISQIHSKAMLKLQSRLGKYKDILYVN